MASEWQINWLPGLLVVDMIRQQIRGTNRPAHQSTSPANHPTIGGNDELGHNTVDFRVDNHL